VTTVITLHVKLKLIDICFHKHCSR